MPDLHLLDALQEAHYERVQLVEPLDSFGLGCAFEELLDHPGDVLCILFLPLVDQRGVEFRRKCLLREGKLQGDERCRA